MKFEKPKMHVNTTSAFNVNYKIAVTCIELHWHWWCSVPVKVKTSLHPAFSLVVDVMNLCFIHALLYNTPD